MKIQRYLPILAAALVASGASAADAAQFHFAITGGFNASFDIDTNKLPDYSSSTSFDYNNVSGTFAGMKFAASTPATSTNASKVQFYEATYGGIGINADGLNRFVGSGAQVYSGSTAAPTFLPGQYALRDVSGFSYPASVLTISQIAVAAVPEPAGWAFMVLGFGATGGMLRRRKVRTAVAYG